MATLAIHRENVSLDDIFDSIVDTFQPLVEDRGITIIADGHELKVWADAVRTRQILINLVKNSIMHGKTLSLVEISARESDGWVSIYVQDDGQGMDNIKPKRFLNGYWQENGNGTRGWGLGLSIVKMLAELQGGKFFFHPSEEGVVAEIVLPSSVRQDR
jgi:signal transduction histidine kinase